MLDVITLSPDKPSTSGIGAAKKIKLEAGSAKKIKLEALDLDPDVFSVSGDENSPAAKKIMQAPVEVVTLDD